MTKEIYFRRLRRDKDKEIWDVYHGYGWPDSFEEPPTTLLLFFMVIVEKPKYTPAAWMRD